MNTPSPQFDINAGTAIIDISGRSAGSGKGLRVGGVPGWDFGEKEVPPSPQFDINAGTASIDISGRSAGGEKGFRVGRVPGWDFGEKEVPPLPPI